MKVPKGAKITKSFPAMTYGLGMLCDSFGMDASRGDGWKVGRSNFTALFKSLGQCVRVLDARKEPNP